MTKAEPRATVRRELISKRPREAVRDCTSGTTLREIDQMWGDELFPEPVDPDPVGGQRVTHFQGYLNQVDWADPGQVQRALRVFEEALKWLFNPSPQFEHNFDTQITRLQRLFLRDGCLLDNNGHITANSAAVISEGMLSNLTEAAVIHEHLARIAAAIERDDPRQAIGSSKELIESTAKLVLSELSIPYPDSQELPTLVKRAQEALAIHPISRSPGPDGTDTVRKILGAATTIATGVAELRNRGYGTGHGQGTVRARLSPRHARLAVNAAKLWCEFMLDTLADPRAPWRSEGVHGKTRDDQSD